MSMDAYGYGEGEEEGGGGGGVESIRDLGKRRRLGG